MHRFFVGELALRGIDAGATLSLPEAVARQMRSVLRIASGEHIVLFDNSGDELVATVIASSRTIVDVEIVERRAGEKESPVRIVLCQGLLKSARFEWVLEKGTELGVSVFAPVLCRRSMAGLEEAGPAKIQRWQRIIQEATEQCGRARVPELLPIRPLPHALNDIPPGALALMPWEEEHTQTLHSALQTARTQSIPADSKDVTVVLFIGPEGGLVAEEVTLAQRHGAVPVTLGSRILRAETAALVSVANVIYELEPLLL